MEFGQFTFWSIYETTSQWLVDSLAINLSLLLTLLPVYIIYKLSYWTRRGIVNVASSAVSQFAQPFHYHDLKLYQKYGKIVGIYEFLQPSLLVGDPELVKQVLVTDFHKFAEHRFGFPGGSKLTTNGLFALKYKPWKRVRPIVSAAFTVSKIKAMISLIKTNVDNLMANIDKIVDEGEPVDVINYFRAFSLDVIINCGFGTEVNAMQDPNNKLVKHAKNLFGTNVSLGALFFLLMPDLALKFNIILFDYNSMMYLSDTVKEIAKQRKESGKKRNDLLQVMLDCVDNEDSQKALTMTEVIDQGVLFIIAGHDTTSSTLSNAAYCMALYPECQAKLIAEVKSVPEDKIFDYDTVDKLVYLDAFINETQRLFATVTRLERRAVVDTYLGDVFVPKGTLVIMPVHAMHRDEANFPNADQFVPERFIDCDEKNYAYQPFATGPRNCVGMKFAILEMKMCLVSLLRKYKFQACPQTEIPLQYFKGQLVTIPKSVTLRILKSS